MEKNSMKSKDHASLYLLDKIYTLLQENWAEQRDRLNVLLRGTMQSVNLQSSLVDNIFRVRQFAALEYTERLLSSPRYENPLRLERYGAGCYSQNDEDGIIQEIFRRIGIKHHSFVEFGAGDGLQNNTLWLLKQHWKGLWMDGDPKNAKNIREKFADILSLSLSLSLSDDKRLAFEETFITRENINTLIGKHLKGEIDLLSLDLDGNDYYIWEVLDVVNPRVVVVEYNAKFLPPVKWTIDYDPDHTWNVTDYFGASLAAWDELGRSKGYRLVGCNMCGINAFFVRQDLLGDKFLISDNLMDYYHPARYWLGGISKGHPADARMGHYWE